MKLLIISSVYMDSTEFLTLDIENWSYCHNVLARLMLPFYWKLASHAW